MARSKKSCFSLRIVKIALLLFFLCLGWLASAQVGRANFAVVSPAGTTSEQELVLSNSADRPAAWVLSTSPGSWIQLTQERVTLAPGESQKVPFRVIVPATATLGEKEGWVYLDAQGGGRTPVRVNTFVGTQNDREAGWEIESAEGSDRIMAKKVIRNNQLFLQLSLRNTGNLWLRPRFNWSLETSKGEVLQKEPQLQDASPVEPGRTTILEMRIVPIKKPAMYRFLCRVEESHDLLPPMEQFVQVQLP